MGSVITVDGVGMADKQLYRCGCVAVYRACVMQCNHGIRGHQLYPTLFPTHNPNPAPPCLRIYNIGHKVHVQICAEHRINYLSCFRGFKMTPKSADFGPPNRPPGSGTPYSDPKTRFQEPNWPK